MAGVRTIGATEVSDTISGYVMSDNNIYEYDSTSTPKANTKLTISKFRTEDKTGSTGYRGDIVFNIAVNDIIGDIKTDNLTTYDVTSVTLVQGYSKTADGKVKYSNTVKTLNANFSDRTYYWAPASSMVQPGIDGVSATIDISKFNTFTRTGITYFIGNTNTKCTTIKVSGLSGLYTPYGCLSTEYPLTVNATNDWFTKFQNAPVPSATTWSGTTYIPANISGILADKYRTLSGTVKNYKNTNTKAGTTSLVSAAQPLDIKTFKFFMTTNTSYDVSINESETMDHNTSVIDTTSTYKGRITSDGGAWKNTTAITSDGTDLQLFEGHVVYPSIDFTNYNGVSNENYSAFKRNKIFLC
jgi:hypothetical protein